MVPYEVPVMCSGQSGRLFCRDTHSFPLPQGPRQTRGLPLPEGDDLPELRRFVG